MNTNFNQKSLKVIITFVLMLSLFGCGSEIFYDFVKKVEDAKDIDNPINPIIKNFESNKLSKTSPTYTAPTNPSDCGYYLIGIRGSQRPSTFVYNNKVYFHIPCKYNDSGAGGWHWALAKWDESSGFNLIDGDAGTSGINEVVNKNDLDQNGFSLGSVRNTYMTDTPSGLLGLSFKWFRSSQYNMTNVPALFPANAIVPSNGYYAIGLSSSTPESFASTDFFVDDQKDQHVFNSNDDTWKGKTKLETELHYHDGLVYIYNTTINAPTSDTHYISVSKSADMRSFTKPTQYLLKDFRFPHVFEYKGRIFMIVFNLNEGRWQLIPGNSPTDFIIEDSVNLNIGSEMVSTGGWDDTPSFTSLPVDEPEIAGVEVLNDKVFVFYMAGQLGQTRVPPNGSSGAPYDSARGIGVFELSFEYK